MQLKSIVQMKAWCNLVTKPLLCRHSELPADPRTVQLGVFENFGRYIFAISLPPVITGSVVTGEATVVHVTATDRAIRF